MTRPIRSFTHQAGQVAIIVAITILLLIMMIGLVVDLGFLYTRKTELQNAADAAALAGAKQLDGTADGIQAAADAAIAMAALNNVDFGGEPIDIDYGNIGFSSTPGGCIPLASSASCAIGLAAKTSPGDKFFVTVDTTDILQGIHPTWFMKVVGIDSTGTYGRAVAGPFVVDITPIAICALDEADCETGTCGYQLGQSYKVGDINPIGPGTFYWINPVTTNPGECGGSGSTSDTLPFICQGIVAPNVALADKILTNTGVSTPQLEALDSRFDSYQPQGKCDPVTAPPDENIKEYLYTDPNVAAWMSPPPNRQASNVLSKNGTIETDNAGVIWSFVRPPGGVPSTGTYARNPTASYPASGTPYSNRSGNPDFNANFFASPSHNSSPERRVMNLQIVDCPSPGGSCRETDVLATGRFFLQRKSNVPSDKDIYVEFGGIIQRPPDVEIKLYR